MKLSELIKYLERHEYEEAPKELLDLLGVSEHQRWNPKFGEMYYYINNLGCVGMMEWQEFGMNFYHYDTFNCFETIEEAKLQNNVNQLNIRVKLFASRNGWIPNWNDKTQKKYYIYYDYDWGVFNIDYRTSNKHFNEVYFETEEDANEFIQKESQYMIKYWLDLGDNDEK